MSSDARESPVLWIRWPRRLQAVIAVALTALALGLAGCGGACDSGLNGRAATSGDEQAAVAHPADDVAHPDSQTEWWYAHAVEPVNERVVVVSFFTAPATATGGFLYTPGGQTSWITVTEARAHSGPGVSLAAGGVRFDEEQEAWIIDQKAGGYEVHLELTDTRPGMTAGPLRFGREHMFWTVPVATGRADGWVVEPDGGRIEIQGWRGYHDHNWGDFAIESTEYLGWEWAAIHEDAGRASVLGGVNQLDGKFTGILVNVTPTGTTACRPVLERERWTTREGFRFPQEVTATCDGEGTTFTVTRPYVAKLATHALTESVGESEVEGSIGLIEHLGPLEP